MTLSWQWLGGGCATVVVAVIPTRTALVGHQLTQPLLALNNDDKGTGGLVTGWYKRQMGKSDGKVSFSPFAGVHTKQIGTPS